MSRGKKDKLYRSFNKGLITEAGFLTYPEDASIDELNTNIYRKGNRSRRLGIDYEEGSTAIALAANDRAVTTEFLWKSPAHKGSLNFLVVQVGTVLHFFDVGVSPVSSGKKSFTIEMTQFAPPGISSVQIAATRVHMASGRGLLFVSQQYIDPFTVTYNPTNDSIEAVRIVILMRDMDGLNDFLPNDAEPATLSIEHHYNLKNQGWVTPGTPSVQTTLPGGGGGVPTAPTPTTPTPPPVAPSSGGTSSTYYNPWTGTGYYGGGGGGGGGGSGSGVEWVNIP